VRNYRTIFKHLIGRMGRDDRAADCSILQRSARGKHAEITGHVDQSNHIRIIRR
jgi:hypothetical protein